MGRKKGEPTKILGVRVTIQNHDKLLAKYKPIIQNEDKSLLKRIAKRIIGK